MITIGVTFCDKDYELCSIMINQIKERIHIPYELIIIDNTEGNKLGDLATFAFGYNAYQFSARYKIIKLAKGDYIWFIDGDDEVLEINEIRFDDDILTFNYYSEVDDVNQEDKLITSDFRDFKYIKKTLGGALWNKFIKRSLFDDIDTYVTDPLLKVVSHEDTFYVTLALKNAKSVHLCHEFIYRHKRGLSFAVIYSIEQFKTLTTGLTDILRLFVKLGYDEQEILDDQLRYFSICASKCEDPALALGQLIRAYPIKDYWVNNLEQLLGSTYCREDFDKVNAVFKDSFGESAMPLAWYDNYGDDGKVVRTYYTIEAPSYDNWNHSVSIILLVYDGNVQYLDSFIKLVQKRIHVDYELVIVDNRDDKSKDINATVVLPKNVGILDGRREGFKASKNDYIWFVDIDDEVLPVHNRNYGNYDIISFPFYDTSDYTLCTWIDRTIEKKDFFTYDTIRDARANLWNKWFKREVLEKVYEDIPSFFDIYYEDCLVYFTSLKHASQLRCFHLDQPIYHHTSHEDSITTKHFTTQESIDRMFMGYEQAFEYMENNFMNCPYETYLYPYNTIFYLRMIDNTSQELKTYLITKVVNLMGMDMVQDGLGCALRDDYRRNHEWVAEIENIIEKYDL